MEKQKGSKMTMRRRSRSMKTLRAEKKIKKRERNSKITIPELIKSSILVSRWPHIVRIRIPAKRYKFSIVVGSSSSATKNAPVAVPLEIPQESINGGTIASTESRLAYLYSNFISGLSSQSRSNNTRPSRVNPSSVFSGSSSSPRVEVQTAMPNYQQLHHPSSSLVGLLEYVTRMANVKQPLNYEFQQRNNPFQGNVTHLHSPNSASGLMTLSDISDSSSSVAMPSYQQQHNTSSSSSMGLPQDYLANASSAVESRHDLSQQPPLLPRGFDLNLPPPDE